MGGQQRFLWATGPFAKNAIKMLAPAVWSLAARISGNDGKKNPKAAILIPQEAIRYKTRPSLENPRDGNPRSDEKDT